MPSDAVVNGGGAVQTASVTNNSVPVAKKVEFKVEDAIDQKHILKETAQCLSIHDWGKQLLTLENLYEDEEKFNAQFHHVKRLNSIFKGRVEALEAMTEARYKSQADDINATLDFLQTNAKKYREKQKQERDKMPEAREQKLRSRAYEICAKEIVKTDSQKNLKDKIDHLDKKVKEKRSATLLVDERVTKRVKQMNLIEKQFLELQNSVEDEKDSELAVRGSSPKK